MGSSVSYQIRPMVYEDLERVMEIEEAAHISPWSKGIFRDCITVGYDCWVIEKRKRVLGFFVARIKAGECHLLNICVSPKAQGFGYGKAMLNYVFELSRNHCERIILEVRPSNTKALAMDEQYKFKKIGHRKDYYTNPDNSKEDGYVLALSLN